MVPTLMPSPGYHNKLCTVGYLRSKISSVTFSSNLLRTSMIVLLHRRMTWQIRSSTDGSGLNPSSTNNNSNGTRLIRAIQAFQIKLSARIKELRKDLPMKLLFFLTGFYCSTAFATVIGQTGDWDILSASLAVAVVEGIGALMYTGSVPLFNMVQDDLKDYILDPTFL